MDRTIGCLIIPILVLQGKVRSLWTRLSFDWWTCLMHAQSHQKEFILKMFCADSVLRIVVVTVALGLDCPDGKTHSSLWAIS